MDNDGLDLLEVLDGIDPAACSYEEWVQIGMGLKDAGHTAYDWDTWSRRDTERYHSNECYRKWDSFQGSAKPVTGGTLVAIAKSQGWTPPRDEGHELNWDDAIGPKDEKVIIDTGWVEAEEIAEPVADDWDQVKDLITYLETLFEAGENVGYVTSTWEKDGRYLPNKGNYDRTAGQLIQELSKCKGDIGAVLGDCNPKAGAWIRFNPLDGEGIKNSNVTEFKYALVESDSMDIDKQNAIIRELELPIIALVHSGNKSLHAIVRVDAPDYDEYRKRVDYLYSVCKKNGLEIDVQNKNPSRLSRMPGVYRNGRKQFLVDTNIGKASWIEWKEWLEESSDDLPDIVDFDAEWNIELARPSILIDGILCQGDKMMLSGPSKAGKSFALIELCAAIAEGREWFSFDCTQGHVLYVNLELKKDSRIRRFREVYKRLGWRPEGLKNIHSLDLRGKAVPMDKLAPKLIRHANKYNCAAIIIDPIYKVITGDENSAEEVAKFCNQLDLLSTELNCAVIYCHHHSKGSQGQKTSMDRASGSGVFARDADALLDLSELPLDKRDKGTPLQAELDNDICKVCSQWMDAYGHKTWREDISQDAQVTADAFRAECQKLLPTENMNALIDALDRLEESFEYVTAWRLEGTLREFPRFRPVNLWFKHPNHTIDEIGILDGLEVESNIHSWKGKPGVDRRNKTQEERNAERNQHLEMAFDACSIDGEVTVKSLCEYTGRSEDTVRRHLKKHGGFWIDEGKVGRKSNV